MQKQQQDDRWTNFQKRCFKKALNEVSTDTPNFYEKVAEKVQGKGTEQVRKYFNTCYRLEGNIYVRVSEVQTDRILPSTLPTKKIITSIPNKPPPIWTRNEHKNFLLGVEKYGMGKWKLIAENCVPSKTIAQISAHALEFFSKDDRKCGRASEIVKNTYGSTVTNDHKDNDVIALDTVPNFPPHKFPHTLNLLPLVSGDYATSSRKQESEEVQEQEGEDPILNLFPTHPTFI